MPIFDFDETDVRFVGRWWLPDCWGDSTLGFVAPRPAYCVNPESGSHLQECAAMRIVVGHAANARMAGSQRAKSRAAISFLFQRGGVDQRLMARRIWSSTNAGSGLSTLITSMRPSPVGRQRENILGHENPAKTEMSGVPHAAATC